MLGNVMLWVMAIYFAAIIITWVWVFYHKIKCWKQHSCTDRKCRYWSWCNHNYAERKKDELEQRKQFLYSSLGLQEDEFHGKTN